MTKTMNTGTVVDGGRGGAAFGPAAGDSVLVLPTGYHIDLAVIRSLGRAGVRVVAGIPEQGAFAHLSRYCSDTLPLPARREDAVEAVLRYAASGAVSHVICTAEDFIVLLNERREELERHVRLLFPPKETFDLCLHKDATLRIAEGLGIPTPRTLVIKNQSDFSRCRGLRFPVVVKPKHRDPRLGGENELKFTASYARSYEELLDLLRHLGEVAGSLMVQEYCPGAGLGVEVLMHRGEPLLVFQHRRLRESPPAGGRSVLCESVAPDPELLGYSVDLLRAMGWEGAAMVEFRFEPETGRVALMEVNGRFWGSLPLAMQAGVDFPYWLYRSSLPGFEPDAQWEYRVGLQCRSLYHDTNRLLAVLGKPGVSKLAEMRDYLKAFRPGVRHYVWSVDDPAPAVASVMLKLQRFVKSAATAAAAAGRQLAASLRTPFTADGEPRTAASSMVEY